MFAYGAPPLSSHLIPRQNGWQRYPRRSQTHWSTSESVGNVTTTEKRPAVDRSNLTPVLQLLCVVPILHSCSLIFLPVMLDVLRFPGSKATGYRSDPRRPTLRGSDQDAVTSNLNIVVSVHSSRTAPFLFRRPILIRPVKSRRSPADKIEEFARAAAQHDTPLSRKYLQRTTNAVASHRHAFPAPFI